MSVIAAIHDSKTRTTWVGSDTAAVMGGNMFICGPKFHRAGRWAIGCCGDARFDTLIKMKLRGLANCRTAVSVAEALRKAILSDKCLPQEQKGSFDVDASFILADNKGVFSICSAFSVDKINHDFLWAQGSGGSAACGAGVVLRSWRPEKRLIGALSAAIEVTANCGGEPWVDKI